MGWNHITLLYQADLKISHVALCVLHVLAKTADETNQCYPSAAYIAEKMNMSTKSVNRGVRELGEAGLIVWKSGRGNRHVNRYQLNVDKLSRLINNRDSQSHLTEDEKKQIGLTVLLNGTDSPIKWDSQSHGREHKEKKKLVSMYPTQQDLFAIPVDNSPKETAVLTSSAEEVLVQPVPKRTEKAPSAPAMMQEANQGKPDYKKLTKTYGWRPSNKQDIEAVWSLIWQMGANREEADRFIRLNSARKWNGVGATCSVKMLAHLWIDAWKKKDFEGWCDERKKRYEAKRRVEEERLRAEMLKGQK